MAIIGLTLSATRPFISSLDPSKGADDEADAATIFTIGTLDSRVVGKLKDAATSIGVDPNQPDKDIDLSVDQNDMHYQAAQFGLRGWKNFKDALGNDIQFITVKKSLGNRSYDVVADSVLALVPQETIAEIGQAVLAANIVTDTEAKN